MSTGDWKCRKCTLVMLRETSDESIIPWLRWCLDEIENRCWHYSPDSETTFSLLFCLWTCSLSPSVTTAQWARAQNLSRGSSILDVVMKIWITDWRPPVRGLATDTANCKLGLAEGWHWRGTSNSGRLVRLLKKTDIIWVLKPKDEKYCCC